MGFLWVSYGFPMGFLWVIPYILHGFSDFSHHPTARTDFFHRLRKLIFEAILAADHSTGEVIPRKGDVVLERSDLILKLGEISVKYG